MEMRMEHDLCALSNSPANGFRIPPALVADCDAEGERTASKHVTSRPGRVDRLLGRVDLNLVLKARDRSITVDDERRSHNRAIHDAFRTEYDRHVRFRCCHSTGGPRALQECCVGWRHRPSGRPI